MKFKVLKITGIAMFLLIAILFGTGELSVLYNKVFNVQKANVERETFEKTKSYNQGMTTELSKSKYEYESEKDESAKKAILERIRINFSNYDYKKIDNYALSEFLRKVQSGELK
jgi:hypothetical protein